jgi:hypothetical protein
MQPAQFLHAVLIAHLAVQKQRRSVHNICFCSDRINNEGDDKTLKFSYYKGLLNVAPKVH